MTTLAEKIADETEAQAGMGYLKRTGRRVGSILTVAGIAAAATAAFLLVLGFLWSLLTVVLLFVAGIAGLALAVGVVVLIVALGLALF